MPLNQIYCYLYKRQIAAHHRPLFIRIIHLACVCLKRWGCGGEQEVTVIIII